MATGGWSFAYLPDHVGAGGRWRALFNSTLVLGNASEESELPLRGKKRKLTRNDWVDYLCREQLGLPTAILDPILHTLYASRDEWVRKIKNSHLSASAKSGYFEILNARRSRMFG